MRNTMSIVTLKNNSEEKELNNSRTYYCNHHLEWCLLAKLVLNQSSQWVSFVNTELCDKWKGWMQDLHGQLKDCIYFLLDCFFLSELMWTVSNISKLYFIIMDMTRVCAFVSFQLFLVYLIRKQKGFHIAPINLYKTLMIMKH